MARSWHRGLAKSDDQAVRASSQLPPRLQATFVNAFADLAKNGLQVGRGETGGVRPAAGLPPQTAQLVQRLIHDVFISSYTTAMRPSLAVAVLGLVLGAISCTFIVRRRAQAVVLPEAAEAGTMRA